MSKGISNSIICDVCNGVYDRCDIDVIESCFSDGSKYLIFICNRCNRRKLEDSVIINESLRP